MKKEFRLAAVLCTFFLLLGCGESKTSMDQRTYYGAFNSIKTAVDDMKYEVFAETYDPRVEPVPAEYGSAVAAFMRNDDVKGTPLEAEAQKLLDKEQEIMEIWNSPDGTIEKLRAAVQEAVDQVEHMKTMVE
ncbi:MAG: hypothetical protein KDA93_06980 [Planctomycetaceae bacterium]|nr:hypothetical protein [Planctomycetaceae bacterium]